MNYKNLIYVFALSLPYLNFSSDSSSPIFSNGLDPKYTISLQQSTNSSPLPPQQAANSRISDKIEISNTPWTEVPEKLQSTLNFPYYREIATVQVYGVGFDKHNIAHETCWFQRPDNLSPLFERISPSPQNQKK